MSVEIVGKSVEFKYGGKEVKVPCENENQAKQVAEELKVVQTKMDEQAKKAGLTPEQFVANLEKSVPPKGVGEKLDKSA